MNDKYFFGKVLLLGEYSVILGSKALSIPYREVSAQLRENANDEEQWQSNKNIEGLYNYIQKNNLDEYFEIERLKEFLANGLYLHSDIPQGYGVGSSGALVAALFYEFGKEIFIDNKKLKDLFGQIESHFHGKSSGLDPLLCFYNKPILIHQDKSIEILDEINVFNNRNFKLELIDSKVIGRTEPLVYSFIENCKNDLFKSKIENELIEYNNHAISSFIHRDYKTFKENIALISKFEFENFQEMIPISVRTIWENELNEKTAYFKLCGSGGGGYFLKFSF